MMETEKPKRKFTFPTAFTILFLLLILIAAATWLVPAGSYDYDENGSPIPGTYHEVAPNPQKLLQSTLKGPINGLYGIEDETGNVDVWNYGEFFGAIEVALFVLLIDRTPFVKGAQHRIRVQKVSPKIFNASYPCWFFARERFMHHFKNYEIIADFPGSGSDFYPNVQYLGFIMELRK